jgi:hypothetical protein
MIQSLVPLLSCLQKNLQIGAQVVLSGEIV